jgi:D-xylose reductase
MQSFKLASGNEIPSVGLGFWKIDQSQAAEMVVQAVDAGYRHLDCACDYGNEKEVGYGIQKVLSTGKIKRDDLWVTSKLWNTYHRAEHVKPALKRTLSDLQLDQLDLYLIHFPIAQRFVPMETRYPPGWFFDPNAAHPQMECDAVSIRETWEAMQELAKEGLVREIGISNFNCALIRDLLSYAAIRPAVLQVELHPYLTQEKLLRYCASEQIAVTGFSPLGAQSYYAINMAEQGEGVLEQTLIQQIAEKHRKTPAQIVLRWGIQRGTSIVPKTLHFNRLRENMEIFDFVLSAAEMSAISSLNRHRRFNDPGEFCEKAFNTFCPIYE